ncbi:MAG: DUF2127 domain-containing protein [Candidatus Paceibacterota bacterium]
MGLEEIIGTEPESVETEHAVYELFKWSLILKGLISIGEIIAGLLLLVVPSSIILSSVAELRALAGSGASYGFIAQHLLSEVDAITAGTVVFAAIYLLSRGLIKLGLVIGLLKNKLWAYPASLVVLGLFLIYQSYQFVTAHSLFVVAISLFDSVVMYLILREWRIVRRHAAKSQ